MSKSDPNTQAENKAETETTAAAPVAAATTPPPLKPVVQYGANSVELHLVPGGRQILVSGKTKLAKLDRDPALELNDPNVRLILAMAAGPDLLDSLDSGDTTAQVAAMNRARGA